ncbi:hypothetical protein PV735_11230 [Streptomyces turgidiscabies]|uniref:Uncharacterized protein n=1 Tax=Streptomyces turgidiscabies (strain Car8) TaxID=698760 RepID=L7EVB2_STRT8|nr:hypothetical protein [Streptomyces turgidiscabies]ELP62819.1 hypothetical protein STRTUCAR8_06424 [Streptomyces turgidiscabies Car8]MDX3493256.1 hypothetical protein [Streptomyces turgidiscabies]GAQ70556.1 hypothetical protein T45_02292 [Streptomyces turgidiscabies]
MAFIGHRCTCGHNDLNHIESENGKRNCTAKSGGSCGKPCTSQGDSEVLPTFDLKGNHVERIIAPGDGPQTEGGTVLVRTCTCDACQALYEQLALAAA